MPNPSTSVDLQLLRATSLLDTQPAAAAQVALEILATSPGHGGAALLLGTARRSCGAWVLGG